MASSKDKVIFFAENILGKTPNSVRFAGAEYPEGSYYQKLILFAR
jgi:hypothetical protein